MIQLGELLFLSWPAAFVRVGVFTHLSCGLFNITINRHCYYIGLEANQNSILYNIGSKTNDLIAWGEQLAGHSDHDRATFFLRSSENDYIGNIAAGSAGRG
jgi:hypothetical protein